MQRSFALIAVLAALAGVRVALTHRVFSPTYDEPVHVAAGFDYLTSHRYTLDKQHPPLARAFFALPFRHVTVPENLRWSDRGNAVLSSSGDYLAGIAAARRGNLFFLVAAIGGVALWAFELFGPAHAVIAAALFSLLPPVLAHGGLATTDMSGAAALPFALLALHRLLENRGSFVPLGIAIGLGLVTKFSFAPFFAVSAMVMLAARRHVPVRRLVAAAAIAFAIVWTVYLFDFGTMSSVDPVAPLLADAVLHLPAVAHIPLPAPLFFDGILGVRLHDLGGHPSFLLGRVYQTGTRIYFPVALAVKTPLAFLALAAIGIFRRRNLTLTLISAAIFAVAAASSINIGIRHLLPLYAPLSLVAADGCVALWNGQRVVAGAAAAWLVVASFLAHPDYLPWMNALAGNHPEQVLSDSNFDWGQDAARLATVCRANGVTSLGVALFGTADLRRLGVLATHAIDPHRAASGWIAISESVLQPALATDRLAYRWLVNGRRFLRVGRTIRLYRPAP